MPPQLISPTHYAYAYVTCPWFWRLIKHMEQMAEGVPEDQHETQPPQTVPSAFPGTLTFIKFTG